MNIVIIGAGFVGMATAKQLKNLCPVLIDTNPEVVDQLNHGQHPICTKYGFDFEGLATTDFSVAKKADYAFICVPTPLQHERLNCEGVASCIHELKALNPDINIVVRSTVSMGFCEYHGVSFMPEFLTEADPFQQTRLIFGGQTRDDDLHTLLKSNEYQVTSSTEAELIKLASNAYLSMRLAYFWNIKNITEKIEGNFDAVLAGICGDKRIGQDYAEPPFLIRGKCLPKDLSEFAYSTNHPLFFEILKQSQMM
ncbi:NAD-binding protein [Acinetobacter pittii]|uniref:NAD-binding protein n=1 Tax=Acinetobacter pittii TaxID=48296 RepID=UPI002AFFA096|nr:NAD-binding protein [Acinetobacter pittii]